MLLQITLVLWIQHVIIMTRFQKLVKKLEMRLLVLVLC